MGSAQWELEPLSSVGFPAFPILLDIPDRDMRITALAGEMTTYATTAQELLGEDGTLMFWSPADTEGNAVYEATLRLFVTEGESSRSATIYITGQPSGDLGQVLYTASIVGEGFSMEQGSLGAVIRME